MLKRASELHTAMVVARCRWNIALEADVLTRAMLADGRFSRLALRDQLSLAIANARPRSRLIPWHLANEVVERILNVVVDGVAGTWI